jgi:hypothetical protein
MFRSAFGLSTLAIATMAVSGVQANATPVLGWDGFGALKLGMNHRQAVASGELADKPDQAERGCYGYDLKIRRTPDNDLDAAVRIGPKSGVYSIAAVPGVRTPEGIGLGSTVAEVTKAYPKARKHGSVYLVTLDSKVDHWYAIGVADGKQVTSLFLRGAYKDDQDNAAGGCGR